MKLLLRKFYDHNNQILAEPTPPKPDQWVEITSPYIGYRSPCPMTGHGAPSVSGGSLVLNEIDEDKDTTL